MNETCTASAEPSLSHELLFESSADCVKVLDPQGCLLQMNRNGRCLMEIDDFTAVEGARWTELWPEEARALMEAEMRRARRGGVGRFSAPCPTAKGTPKHWDVCITPIEDADGTFQGYLSVSRDVSSLHQALAALNAANAQLEQAQRERERAAAFTEGQKRALELAVGDAPLHEVLSTLISTAEANTGTDLKVSVLLIDANGKRLRLGAAPSFADSYNKKVDGLPIGPRAGSCGTAAFTRQPVGVRDIATDPLWDAFRDLALEQGLRACWSHPILSSQGRLLGTLAYYFGEAREPTPAEAQSMQILLHTAALVLERRTETLERQAAQEALRRSEAKFRTITNAMPQMAWSTRSDGHADYFSERWYEFTGVGEGASDGAGWSEVVHPDDRPRAHAAWSHSLRTGEPYEIEYRMRHHSGDYRWALGRALPVRDEAGQIARWMGTCTDIHEQRRNSDELREANQRKDEFLAMLAHELRNPLAPISAAAEILRIAQVDEARMRKLSDVIARQAGHMTGLIEDLIDVSRVTRGKIVLDTSPQDLGELLAEAVEQVRPLADAQGHQLRVVAPRSAVRVMCDRKRMVQCVANLLQNAVKYTPAGGRIELDTAACADGVRIRVRDNGVGLSPQLLERAFELFVQGERSGDRSQGGLGIGLSLVRSLVALHGGHVEGRSEGVGKGSEFTIVLPVIDQGAPVPGTDGLPDSPRGGGLRVLVVDDNIDAAEMLGLLVETDGHRVHLEHHPRRALEALQRFTPHVCLLDIGLPDMSGNELARRLREDPRTAKAVLIAVSGYGQPQDREDALAAGFDHHLVKPVPTPQLLALLDAVAHPLGQ